MNTESNQVESFVWCDTRKAYIPFAMWLDEEIESVKRLLSDSEDAS